MFKWAIICSSPKEVLFLHYQKLGHRNPFGKTEALLSHRNESPVWNFSLCFNVKTMNKQLQPILRIGGPEVLTYTETAIEEVRIWKSYINLSMENYIRDRIKLLIFYDISIGNSYHFLMHVLHACPISFSQ